jgi:hypothetical protein
MSAGFTRRFTFDPGLAEILKIEGVVIIDREAVGSPTGQATGASALVAEFEDGPFNTPTEIFSGVDQVATFGSFGFFHDGLVSANPCARARKADSALAFEYWNGNGFLALSQKTFPRLFLVRPDTSVGAASFTKLPSLIGNANFSWDLEPGATAVFQTAFGTTSTATFSAAAALLTSAAGTYPTTFAGGESMNVTIDEGTPLQIGPIDITFTAAQTTQALVIARINAVLGYTAAVNAGGGVTTLAGRIRGNTGSVKVNSVSGALVTTATGFSAASAVGTGNVSNIDAVSFAEVKNIIQAAVSGSVVDRDSNGNLRVAHTTAVELLYTTASTADNLGFTEAQGNHQPDGFAYLYSGAGTYPVTYSSDTLTLGFDGDQNVTVSFTNGSTTQAATITAINAAFGRTVVEAASATILRFTGRVNGGEVRIVAGTAAALTALGLTLRTQTAVANVATVIPAGTRVRTTAGAEWLTMQSTAVLVDSIGPYSIKVRPSLDDGTASAATAATVTTLVDSVPLAAFSVTNPLGLAAALSEAAIDAAYSTAIDATKDSSAVSRQANFVWSARQSNAIRAALRTNANRASNNGLRGRVAPLSPPLSTTTRAMAKSTSAAPGVGATRDERVPYCFPGVALFVPQIAVRGTGGGAGFTADGIIDMHSDGWFASVAGLLPPEQNAGQETSFMSPVLSVERGNPDVQRLEMEDYISFKAAGICAPRVADGTPIFQSDVTSYDPNVGSSKVDGPRRRFADFAEDSLAVIASKFAKKPMTAKRRSDVYGEFDAFCLLLLSPGDEDSSRIEGYRLDAKSGNPQAALDAGVYRIKTKIGMNPDMLDIVIDATIGRGQSVFNTTT